MLKLFYSKCSVLKTQVLIVCKQDCAHLFVVLYFFGCFVNLLHCTTSFSLYEFNFILFPSIIYSEIIFTVVHFFFNHACSETIEFC